MSLLYTDEEIMLVNSIKNQQAIEELHQLATIGNSFIRRISNTHSIITFGNDTTIFFNIRGGLYNDRVSIYNIDHSTVMLNERTKLYFIECIITINEDCYFDIVCIYNSMINKSDHVINSKIICIHSPINLSISLVVNLKYAMYIEYYCNNEITNKDAINLFTLYPNLKQINNFRNRNIINCYIINNMQYKNKHMYTPLDKIMHRLINRTFHHLLKPGGIKYNLMFGENE